MKQIKTWMALAVAALSFSLFSSAAAGTITLLGENPGPTPFIATLNISVNGSAALDHIDFKVYPKAGSSTRPVYARYSAAYIQSRGYADQVTGQIHLPVFGLYANANNTVALVAGFADQTTTRLTVNVQTPAWNDPAGIYQTPWVVQPRLPQAKLSYDFILLKSYAAANTPIIIDTDGQVRWVGTAGVGTLSGILFQNGLYISDGNSGMIRMEFDGSFRNVADFSNYGGLGINFTGHHNWDYGKFGIIVEVNTNSWTECVDIEVDGAGNVLHSWNLADIISAAMTAGGDDPTDFVKAAPTDWFHNNAVAYRPSDDSMIFSSRENFVICTDYSTGAIKWILGDPTKKWYQYSSLRQYALTTVGTTLPPIGQHAVSIHRDRLLLFDNGAKSLNNTPAGANRGVVILRKYAIDAASMTANEIWDYDAGGINNSFCGSVYEDGSQCYLGNYPTSFPVIILGLDATGAKAFDYRYPPVNGCGTSFNATPIHLESLRF